MTPEQRRQSTGSRVFRALLRLLPFDFRVEHGREMEQVFRAQHDDARHTGTVRAVTRLWFETVHDLLTTAPRQHLSMLRQDVGYTLRTLRRSPGFTAAALLTLAIGISASAAIFTIINAFLFRPLPVDQPAQLVSIATAADGHIEMPHGVSFRDLQDYSTLTDVFTGLLGYQATGAWLDAGSGMDRVVVEAITENSFTLLGVRPAIGSVFTTADVNSPVIVLTHEYWRSRFNGDPTIVGRSIRMNGEPVTVIGVADERFTGLESLLRVSGFVPISMLGQLNRGRSERAALFEARDRHELFVIGRLKPGVDIARARAALAVKARVLAEEFPATNAGISLFVVPETQARPVPQNGPMFHVAAAMLTLLAGLLLCITSANVANMLLARAASRGREMALRAALGARTGRIGRQLFTESIVLAVLGSVGGVLLCMLASAAMERGIVSLSFEVPLRVDFSVDWRVLGVTLAVAIGAGVIAGLAPTLHALRTDVNALLKTGGRREGSERGWLRGMLVVAQIAVSLVLLIVGGLFVRTLDRARNVDVGFRSDHVLIGRVDLSRDTYTNARRTTYYRDARDRVAALPGVRAAAWISGTPFGYEQDQTTIEREGVQSSIDRTLTTMAVSVAPEYFDAANVRIVSGRPFDGRDTASAPAVVLVNETLARTLWADQNPIGRRIHLGSEKMPADVIGVVKDGKYIFLWESPRAMLLRPLAQAVPASATLEVVTTGRPADLAAAVHTALSEVDPEVPAYRFQTMTEYLEYGSAFLLFRLGGLVAGAFGALGLILASIGVYGVVAYDITQRTHEIGVRMALGALRSDVLREVLARGFRLAVPGVLLGTIAAAVVATSLRTMLLDVSPFDPATYAGTAALLLGVCLVASLVPAFRAASASPLDALRAD